MQKNRRNFSRVKFDSKVFINCGKLSIEAQLADISLKGALVNPNDRIEIDEGDKCIFEFHLNDSDVVLKIDSLLVYDENNHLGLKFDNIDLESMIHLRRLVELNVGDPDQIQKELFFLVSQVH